MNETSRISNPAAFNYSQALLNLAKKKGNVRELDEQAIVLLEVLAHENARLAHFLEGPQIPTEEKIALVQRVFGGKVDESLSNLLALLMRRDRMHLASDVLRIFSQLAASEQGIEQGVVRSAREMTASQKIQMRTALEKFTNSQLRLDYVVDPGLIGGVVFQYKDVLIDFSVRGRLDELRHKLEAVKVA